RRQGPVAGRSAMDSGQGHAVTAPLRGRSMSVPGAGDTTVVAPRSARAETLLLGAIVAVVFGIGQTLGDVRRVDPFEPRLFGWQVSSFYDLGPTDQAIYNALITASDELWWIHGGRQRFPEQNPDLWPTVAELEERFAIAPFVKDLAWSQHGRVEWQRIAAF